MSCTAEPVNDARTIWRTRTEYDRADVFVVLKEATTDQVRFMQDWNEWCLALGWHEVIFESEFAA